MLSVSTIRPLAIDAVNLPPLFVALLMSLTTSFSVAAPLRLIASAVAGGSVSWIVRSAKLLGASRIWLPSFKLASVKAPVAW